MIERDQTTVVITDIRMPFWSMVTFMVKFTIASIPAFLILVAVSTAVSLLFGGLLGGLGEFAE